MKNALKGGFKAALPRGKSPAQGRGAKASPPEKAKTAKPERKENDEVRAEAVQHVLLAAAGNSRRTRARARTR